MFLKNYTSDVAASITIGRIEKVLLRCGVTGIMKEYSPTGEIAALTFRLPTEAGPQMIRLPADIKKAQDALWLDYIGDDLLPDGKIKWTCRKKMTRKSFAEQAEKTAWKIMQDWIEVQMSMIQLKQAEPLQVFIAYIHDGRRTYYEAIKDAGFIGLALKDRES